MAVQDIFDCVPTEVANNGTLDIRPAGTAEAVIHNISTGAGSCELYKYDGITLSEIDTASGWVGQAFHVRNAVYLQVKNISGVSLNICFDGIYMKA